MRYVVLLALLCGCSEQPTAVDPPPAQKPKEAEDRSEQLRKQKEAIGQLSELKKQKEADLCQLEKDKIRTEKVLEQMVLAAFDPCFGIETRTTLAVRKYRDQTAAELRRLNDDIVQTRAILGDVISHLERLKALKPESGPTQ